jgi:hypothetical protein
MFHLSSALQLCPITMAWPASLFYSNIMNHMCNKLTSSILPPPPGMLVSKSHALPFCRRGYRLMITSYKRNFFTFHQSSTSLQSYQAAFCFDFSLPMFSGKISCPRNQPPRPAVHKSPYHRLLILLSRFAQ